MQDPKPILIFHPDFDFCHRIQQILSKLNDTGDMEIETEHEALPKSFKIENYRLCVIHEEAHLPNGDSIISGIQNYCTKVPVVLISDRNEIRNAVYAIRNGIYDYFDKTSDTRIIAESLAIALKNTTLMPAKNSENAIEPLARDIITCSDNINRVLKTARQVAPATATVMIQGDSGTGKELFARFIHEHSGRSKKSFIAMNCAALPENLAESELFGYEKGAFTGATQSRMGKFEQAHGGTLLLDEISEMPLSLQVKLLRVLQEKMVDPVGGRKAIQVDVRVIATSNRDLAKMVHEGEFREDLYYRLRVIPLTIPPLKERKEDIPLLVDHFLKKYAPACPGKDPYLSSDAMKQLSIWKWPGNVRELENTIERAVLISDGEQIGPEHLLLDHDLKTMDHNDSLSLVGMTVKEMEKKLIGQTLKTVNDNRTHAAKMLGISIRTLRNKLNEYENSELPVYERASAK